jgi:DNA invertase Pin-like site-specific DNA recombinase
MSPRKAVTAKPIIVYTRVSEQGTRSDEELLSHDLQRAKVEAYLKAHGLTAAPEEFKDNDKSGGSMSRPALDRAVAGIKDGTYGGIAVAYLDRFARTVPEALVLIAEIEAKGAAVIALDAQFDTTTAMGKAMLTIVLAFNALQRDQTQEKAYYLADTKLDEGTSLGGLAPVGYEFEITGKDSNGKPILGWYIVKQPEADIVTEAFEQFASGELPTPGRVADFLNEHGIRTSRGNLWTKTNVYGFLKREAYIGTRVWNRYGKVDGKKVIVETRKQAGAHTGIVVPETFARVQRKIAPKPGGKTYNRNGEGFVLGKGLVRCGCKDCGKGMTKGATNGGGHTTLRCDARGSGHPTISLEAATAYVLDYVIGVASHLEAKVARVEDSAEGTEAARALARAEKAYAEVKTLLGGGAVPEESAPAVALREAQEAVDSLVAGDAPYEQAFSLTPEQARTMLAEMSITDQRDFIRSVIAKITLLADSRGGTPAERLVIELQPELVAAEARREARS